MEVDLPQMEAAFEKEAVSPGADSPDAPQTGVWNQHTGE